MRPVKRALCVAGVVLGLAVPALASAGCGGGSHYVGGAVAHHVINHFVRSQAGRRRVNKLFCVYHGHRILVDVRNGHYFAAGLNGLAAYHACKGGFGHG
jgi:hypothetical protein